MLIALVTNGIGTAVTVAVIVLVVNQLEAHLLQPVIMGRSVELYPLVVLLSLLVGSVGAGIFGAIIAVPITAVIWDAIKLWDAPEPELQDRLDVGARLRRLRLRLPLPHLAHAGHS